MLASPALANDVAPVAKDGQGNPLRGARGGCVGLVTKPGEAQDPSCVEAPRRTTYRILQNLVPQPWVTYEPPAPLPEPETLRLVPPPAFATGHAGLSPELREALYGVLKRLEGHPLIERFEVVGHGDGTPNAEFGRWLGEKRAESVRNFLVARGVPANAVGIRGALPARPELQGRVELSITVRGRR